MNIDWINFYKQRPSYGEPCILKIGTTVQQITYMLDGSDDGSDWFSPVFFDDSEVSFFPSKHNIVEWIYVSSLTERPE